MNYNIVKILFGSHLYGLNTPTSDEDFKGIYMPTKRELLLGTYKKSISYSTGDNDSKNGAGDLDMEVYALPYFLKLACQGETVALDMLHADGRGVELGNAGYIWTDLVANRDKFYTKNLKAYMGYVKKQAAKYGIKGSRLAGMSEMLTFLSSAPCVPNNTLSTVWAQLPESEFIKKLVLTNKAGIEGNYLEVNGKKYQDTNSILYVVERLEKAYDSYGHRAKQAEQNEGVDWKAVSHALRAGYQLRDIFVKGFFEYPLDQTQFILDVKTGVLDFKSEVSPMLEGLIDEIDVLVENSDLPETVDTEYWDDWLLKQYEDYLL